MDLEQQHVKDDAWINDHSNSKWERMILIGSYWTDGLKIFKGCSRMATAQGLGKWLKW